MEITKADLEHLAKLSKIELDPNKEDSFLRGFKDILAFFEKLQTLPAKPETLLTAQKQELREDDTDLTEHFTGQDDLIKDFPQKKERYLKVPTVIKDHKDHK